MHPPQISHLQQLYASGQYSLQLPHRAHTGVRRTHQDTSTKPGGSGIPPALCAHQGEDVGAVEHVFTVCIEGVREMTAFASTVWGEADCFVQYHFPSVSSDDDDEHGQSPSLSLMYGGCVITNKTV